MVELQNRKYGFRCFGLIVVMLLLHNLDPCTCVGSYYDKGLETTAGGGLHREATTAASDVEDMSLGAESHMPPIVFPTVSANSSSSVPICTIDDCRNITTSHIMSVLTNMSSLSPAYSATPTASSRDTTSVSAIEVDDMLHDKKYKGQYDLDKPNEDAAKKYNHTKETKNATKSSVAGGSGVVGTKKEDTSENSTTKSSSSPQTPEVVINNKTTATVDDGSGKTETAKPENKNKTNSTTLGKTEGAHKGEATLIVPVTTTQPSSQRELEDAAPRKSSTLREIGKTLAAILVTIVGTASVLFVGFVMWRRISRRYYGHREMLINEDDFEEVSDLHHFEGTTDTPPSQILSQR